MMKFDKRLISVTAFYFLALLTIQSCRSIDAKKDRNAGHPHKGLLKKLTPGRFNLDLSSKDESVLGGNQAVMKHVESEGGQGGTAICGKLNVSVSHYES